MKWTEESIANALFTRFSKDKYVIVVPNCFITGHECDIFAVTHDLRIVDFEIKISKADLKSDQGKTKWWKSGVALWNEETRKYHTEPSVKLDHPPKVWKHYYVMPKEIWSDDLYEHIPEKSGVLLLKTDEDGNAWVEMARAPKPNRDTFKLTSGQVLNAARLLSYRFLKLHQRISELEKK